MHMYSMRDRGIFPGSAPPDAGLTPRMHQQVGQRSQQAADDALTAVDNRLLTGAGRLPASAVQHVREMVPDADTLTDLADETTQAATQVASDAATVATIRDQVHDISNIATPDNLVGVLLRDEESETRTAVMEILEVAPLDYTGATDVGEDLNAILVHAATRGVPVNLGAGTLRVETAIRPQSGSHLIGAGIGKTVIRPQGQAHGIHRPGPIEDCVFRDFEIDGSDQTMPDGVYHPTWAKGIFIEHMRRVTFENLYIHDTGATGLGVDFLTGVIHNVWAVGCGRLNDGTGAGGSGIGIGVGTMDPDWEPLTISSCHTENNARFGIFLETQLAGVALPGGITITGCTATGNLDGIGDCGATGAVIAHNHVRDNLRAGIAVDTGTMERTIPGRYSLIQSNDVRGNGQFGIHARALGGAEYLQGLRILDNHIWETSGVGIDVITSALSAESQPYVKALRIEGNDVHDNTGNGVHFRHSGTTTNRPPWRHVTVRGNRMWNNGATAADAGLLVNVPTEDLIVVENETWDEADGPARSIVVASGQTRPTVERNYTHKSPAV